MNDQIVQVISSVLNSASGDQVTSVHGLSKSGVLYQLVSDDETGLLNWVKVIESPITNN